MVTIRRTRKMVKMMVRMMLMMMVRMMTMMMVRMMMRMMQEDQACSSLTVDIVGWAVQPGCRASNYDVDVLQEQCRAGRST